MTREGFKIFLYPGMAKRYERHHNELWPEMKEMTRRYSGENCSISLDREINVLYGYLEVEDETLWVGSADMPANHKWWDYMTDIMETNRDNSPICVDLQPAFYLD